MSKSIQYLLLMLFTTNLSAPMPSSAAEQAPESYRFLGTQFISEAGVAASRLPEDDSFGDYHRLIAREINAQLKDEPTGPSAVLIVTFIVKPSGKTAFWFEAAPAGMDDALAERLDKRLRQLPAPRPKGGSLAIRLYGYLWGEVKNEEDIPVPTLPAAWLEKIRDWRTKTKKDRIPTMDEVIELVLPN